MKWTSGVGSGVQVSGEWGDFLISFWLPCTFASLYEYRGSTGIPKVVRELAPSVSVFPSLSVPVGFISSRSLQGHTPYTQFTDQVAYRMSC